MQNVEHTEEQGYEAPHIESVLTPDELEREVLYAGIFQLSSPGNASR